MLGDRESGTWGVRGHGESGDMRCWETGSRGTWGVREHEVSRDMGYRGIWEVGGFRGVSGMRRVAGQGSLWGHRIGG